MPVPTITSLSPTSGPSMGANLVILEGTNFQVPVVVTVPGQVTAAPDPSIRITVGGEVVDWAKTLVMSSTRVGFVAPQAVLSRTVDTLAAAITVENIDATGAVIVGETTTINGYEYVRPDISHSNQGSIVAIIRSLITKFRSQIVPNVAHATHPDWDRDVATVNIDTTELPALFLLGPTLEHDSLYDDYDGTFIEDVPVVGEVFHKRGGRAYALAFDVVGVADRSVLALNMMDVFMQWIERNNTVAYTDHQGNEVELDIRYGETGDPEYVQQFTQADRDSGIYKWTAQFVVRGFRPGQLAGFDLDMVRGLTTSITDIELQDIEQLTDNTIGTRAPPNGESTFDFRQYPNAPVSPDE